MSGRTSVVPSGTEFALPLQTFYSFVIVLS
jgi:hypothetical protein